MINHVEAEQAVIGSILIDSRCLTEVSEKLAPENFSMELNRAMYEAALALMVNGRAIDPVTILEEAKRNGVDVPRNYAINLMDTTPTAANVTEYISIVKRNALARGVDGLLSYIKTGLNEYTDPGELLGEMIAQASALEQEGTNKLILSPVELAMRWMDHRMTVDSGGNKVFIKTKLRSLDNITEGLIKGGTHIIAARPGNGKTTLALNIADNIAKEGHPVLYVSLEMDDKQIMAKRVAREAGINSKKLIAKELSEKENEKNAAAIDSLMKRPLHINYKPNASMSDIAIMARQVKGLELIVIDYIGITDPDKNSKNLNRVEQISTISRQIKNLARRLDIPIIALCQLNREVEKRQDKRPTMADLRDSGAIEQDADTITFLYRKEYYGNMEDLADYEPLEVEVIVAKNRHGPTGQCKFAFFPALSRFMTADSSPRAGAKEALTYGSL